MPSTVYDPPALESGTLRVTPLGGLGEIGRNMTVFEYGGKLLIVDCGVLFPEEHQPGVDLILPDFEPIKQPARRRRRRRAHARPRGPHRRGAVPAQAQAGHPPDRVRPDARADRGEAQGAPHQAVQPHRQGGPAREASARSTSSSSRSTTRSPTRSPSRSARPRAWCSPPATSRWTSCPSTAA